MNVKINNSKIDELMDENHYANSTNTMKPVKSDTEDLEFKTTTVNTELFDFAVEEMKSLNVYELAEILMKIKEVKERK